MLRFLFKPKAAAAQYRNPVLTVDIIIETPKGIVLIERRNPPYGWALPGGFVDYGETLETAARREAKEETSLDVELKSLLYVYSHPSRDPRQHTVSAVFVARAEGTPRAADDAKSLRVFKPAKLPAELAFDHRKILDDYLKFRKTGRLPKPV
jgi:ADP-ribose pyrophosphatase YjhB (NUDIX family)